MLPNRCQNFDIFAAYNGFVTRRTYWLHDLGSGIDYARICIDRIYFEKAKRQPRNQRGSMLILMLAVMSSVIFLFGMSLNQYCLALCKHNRYQSVVDAASLAAAYDLSEIVVEDANWGFISLSNYPPIGRATLAADAEPTPVMSINNVIGTTRLDAIVAEQLQDGNLISLSRADVGKCHEAVGLLQQTLNSAFDPASSGTLCDKDGNRLSPLEHVKALLQSGTEEVPGPGGLVVQNIKVSLGWLKDGGTTNTRIPGSCEAARIGNNGSQSDKYRSCVNVPVGHDHFYFAATSKSAALANVAQFMASDGIRFSSVVKVEADVLQPDPGPFGLTRSFHVASVAVPFEQEEVGPSGALMVSLPCGMVKSVSCLDDLLHSDDGGASANVESYASVNGDYPVDQQAQTGPASLAPWGVSIEPSQAFAAGIYCWLRSAHSRPRIDSFLATLSSPLSTIAACSPGSNLVYEFDVAGNVRSRCLSGAPLPTSELSDQQLFYAAHYADYSVSCYNNVCHVGNQNGGKHAGLPIAGDPINWCDLVCFNGSVDEARQLGKGELGSGLTACGDEFVTAENSVIEGAVSSRNVRFNVDGRAVGAVPRKTFYSGGLAVQFCISTM